MFLMQAQGGFTRVRMQVRVRVLRKASLRRGAQLPIRLQAKATRKTSQGEPTRLKEQDQQNMMNMSMISENVG